MGKPDGAAQQSQISGACLRSSCPLLFCLLSLTPMPFCTNENGALNLSESNLRLKFVRTGRLLPRPMDRL